jgi:uncharacterized repeat protein (TIGR03803 family)
MVRHEKLSWLLAPRFFIMTTVTAAALTAPGVARAQVRFDVLHAFAPSGAPTYPNAPLMQAADGNFYGTTRSGGTAVNGTIFKITPGGTITVLHSFTGNPDGSVPYAGLIQATDGNFYGTTNQGGDFFVGAVFKMTPAGTVTIIHSFTSSTEGGFPYAGLIQASDGNFYGTTSSGGSSNRGTVFKVTPAGVLTVLHAFTGNPDGGGSLAPLVQGTDGNFYGTTAGGGTSNLGTAFVMTPTGTLTVLHSFTGGADGSAPQYGGLIQAADGNFYGTTYNGAFGFGTVFKMTSGGTVTTPYSFGGSIDGGNPVGGVVQGADGNFYGTTSRGGLTGNGVVFKLPSAGMYSVLHSFAGGSTDGANPQSGVIQGTDGNFYGTTFEGGAGNAGTIFKLTSGGAFTLLQTLSGGPDGASPFAGLVAATDGNLYGTTAGGGAGETGTIFRITPSGAETVLYSFTEGFSRGTPFAPLIQGTDGNFYGTTFQGGAAADGTIFKMTPAGAVTVLYAFAGGAADGAAPRSGLVQANDGNFYGTTNSGGPSNRGTVFRMTPAGVVTILHFFAGGAADGANPRGTLIQANDGNLYGTTALGGTANGGTAFQITLAGTVTLVHSFTAAEGRPSFSGLIQATDGNFYGLTVSGGASGSGTIFRVSAAGAFTILHSFSGGPTDGSQPWGSLVEGPAGSFYGTTSAGGAFGFGTVFQATAAGAVTILHSFNNADGATPRAGLARTSGGHLYGTTSGGGTSGFGVVFHLSLTPVLADFDADKKTEIAVYRPSTSTWYLLNSGTNFTTFSSYAWGASGDKPVPGDYDGDGKPDIAVYRPSSGTWYILKSSTNYTTFSSYAWGVATDVPAQGDFDGDGKTDIAVFRPSTGQWFILYSSSSYTTFATFAWGANGDSVVQDDYDGDGKTDIAVFRPSTGTWYILKSSTGFTTFQAIAWGTSGDIAVPGDFDGDGKTDIAVFRPSTGQWFILYSSTAYTTFASYAWGTATDVPVQGDYDGDGKADIVVFRPSTGQWFILKSSTSYTTFSAYSWGVSSDVPVLGRQ